MVVDILTFVRDDATLYNLIGRMMSISEGGSDEPVDMARYQSEIDEAIADIEAEEITDPFTMTHTAYVDKGGNIVDARSGWRTRPDPNSSRSSTRTLGRTG